MISIIVAILTRVAWPHCADGETEAKASMLTYGRAAHQFQSKATHRPAIHFAAPALPGVFICVATPSCHNWSHLPNVEWHRAVLRLATPLLSPCIWNVMTSYLWTKCLPQSLLSLVLELPLRSPPSSWDGRAPRSGRLGAVEGTRVRYPLYWVAAAAARGRW